VIANCEFGYNLSMLQDPVSSSGYICQFKDLQVQCVMLDEVMHKPEQPELNYVVVMEAEVSR